MAATRCVSLLAFAMLASSGCGFVELPSLEGRPADVRLIEDDGCELHVLRQEGEWIEEMEHPYVTNMVPPWMAAPPVAITFGGTGWRQVEIVVVAPNGLVDDTYRGDGSGIQQSDFVAFPVDVPGTWRFRITELTAGCGREFSVEVRQPG